jgi:hypothetical protein
MAKMMQCTCGATVAGEVEDDERDAYDDPYACPICHGLMSDFKPEALPEQPKCECGTTMLLLAASDAFACLKCGRVKACVAREESPEQLAARIENERIGRELLEKAKADLRSEGASAEASAPVEQAQTMDGIVCALERIGDELRALRLALKPEVEPNPQENWNALIAVALAGIIPERRQKMRKQWPLLNVDDELQRAAAWIKANRDQVDDITRALFGCLASKHDRLLRDAHKKQRGMQEGARA